jgi:ABC-2 type transport system ATP-binding protein
MCQAETHAISEGYRCAGCAAVCQTGKTLRRPRAACSRARRFVAAGRAKSSSLNDALLQNPARPLFSEFVVNQAESALRVRALHKRFSRPAVQGIDLDIPRGEFYGLLGPNGAGKTTTLRMICCLLAPDAGSIEVCGVDALADPIAAKRWLAWLPDEPMLYDKLTPIEYLEFVAGLWRMDPGAAQRGAEELLRQLELWEHREERCEGFSRGMKQKLALAGALLHEPRVLVLDEPLTGLDAAVARQVKDLLLSRARAGAAVIYATHILDVAERLVDRIGIVQHGRLLAEGTLEELRVRSGRSGSTLEEVFLQLLAEQTA